MLENPLLELKNLHYSYDSVGLKKSVLKGINLKIYQGQKWVLLGANGIGKSTLLLTLNGLLPTAPGQIRFENQAIEFSKKSLQHLRSQIVLVLQDPDEQLFAPTVYEDLCFGPRNQGLDKAEIHRRILALSAELEMAELLDQPIHLLSLGQRKKVALAGALVMQPKLLVLDEPTAGLDPRSEDLLLQVLDQHCRAGMSVLFSTHDVDLAWRFADYSLLLENGQALAKGPCRPLLSQAELMAKAHLRLPYILQNPSLFYGGQMNPNETAVILLGHGSRAPGALEAMHQVAQWIKDQYLVQAMEVCQMDPPGTILKEGVEIFQKQGFNKVLVLPYFLHFGNHLREDIPEMIAEAKELFPQVEIKLGRHLGADQAIADLVFRRLNESLNHWEYL